MWVVTAERNLEKKVWLAVWAENMDPSSYYNIGFRLKYYGISLFLFSKIGSLEGNHFFIRHIRFLCIYIYENRSYKIFVAYKGYCDICCLRKGQSLEMSTDLYKTKARIMSTCLLLWAIKYSKDNYLPLATSWRKTI
jgi:hypothetical protein